ncbi:hypothetical protein LCGC14_3016370, partial [marine sediment metagenome]
ETSFTAALARIGFLPHEATFRAARSEYAMSPEEAMRIARIATWHALLRRWKKFKA